MNKEYKTLNLNDIQPYENNPRINDNAVGAVAESIRQCGYCDPIEVDENNVILSGHTRYKALQTLGYTECDCVVISGLTDEQKRKYRILANKTNELATWDMDKLEIGLEGLDFSGFEFGVDFDFFNEDEDENSTEREEQEAFSIDEIEEVNGYDKNNDNREYFTTAFTFPTSQKEQIMRYLRQHKQEITEGIIRKAGKDNVQ